MTYTEWRKMMGKLQLGHVVNMIVEDETKDGYILSNGKDEVLLPTDDKTILIGSTKKVFLYLDRDGKMKATEHIPKIHFDQFDWAEVVDVRKDLGVFVDIGIPKDLLVSRDDLPLLTEIWPIAGDQLLICLDVDKRGRLLAKLATEQYIQKIAKPAPKQLFNQNVTGRVYRTHRIGTFLLTEEKYRCFVHKNEQKDEPRLGSLVTGRVIAVKDDGTLNVSLLPRKQESIDQDAEIILNYLLNRPSRNMPYGDKSLPEDIRQQFGMSKAAFKRALGKLMKEKKVYQKDGWTFLYDKQP